MPRSLALVILLAAVTGIGPFAMQALAPALPGVAESFQVSPIESQLMLSLSLVSMALATLFWGPLADRFGRRPMILTGMALTAAGSIMAAMAPTLGVAIFGRLIQSGGAVAGMVLARVVAQDTYGRAGAADMIGKITAVMVVAPMVAPALSGLVIDTIGWRGVFWAVGALATLLTLWTWARLDETLPADAPRQGGGLPRMLQGFRIVSGRRDYWAHAGFASFSLAAFLFFVGSAPYIMQVAFGRGATAYGVYFMILSGCYMAANFTCGTVARRFGAPAALTLGATLSVLGPATGAVATLIFPGEPLAMFIPAAVSSIGAGFAVPQAMAGAIGAAPDRAGAASSLVGFCQFLLAGALIQAAGFLPHDRPWVMLTCMATLSAVGLALYLGLSRTGRAKAV